MFNMICSWANVGTYCSLCGAFALALALSQRGHLIQWREILVMRRFPIHPWGWIFPRGIFVYLIKVKGRERINPSSSGVRFLMLGCKWAQLKQSLIPATIFFFTQTATIFRGDSSFPRNPEHALTIYYGTRCSLSMPHVTKHRCWSDTSPHSNEVAECVNTWGSIQHLVPCKNSQSLKPHSSLQQPNPSLPQAAVCRFMIYSFTPGCRWNNDPPHHHRLSAKNGCTTYVG